MFRRENFTLDYNCWWAKSKGQKRASSAHETRAKSHFFGEQKYCQECDQAEKDVSDYLVAVSSDKGYGIGAIITD